MRKIQGTTVVITGASAGVGRATALEFAKQGARVGLIARGKERLESAVSEIRGLGGTAEYFVADTSDSQKMEEAAAYFEQRLGPIETWVNNAMLSVFSPVKEMKPEEYRRVTEVTYLGYVHGTLCALKRMLPRDRGMIIQVGSALAYRSIPLQSAYCGAKHAVNGFTESLRTELLHDRSRVELKAIHLPAVNTPQFRWVKSRLPREAQPVPPIFQPEVPARAIVWIASNPRRMGRELWLGSSAVKAIVAEKLAPRLADRYLAATGYDSQQVSIARDPSRPDNLWSPPPGDPGSHGVFDSRARKSSLEFWFRRNRRAIFAFASIAALGAARLRKAS